MEYILIPSKFKVETAFFLNLLAKMKKSASTLKDNVLEELIFTYLVKLAEKEPLGRLSKVKSHLERVVAGK